VKTQHAFQLDKEFVQLQVFFKLLSLAPSGGAGYRITVSNFRSFPV